MPDCDTAPLKLVRTCAPRPWQWLVARSPTTAKCIIGSPARGPVRGSRHRAASRLQKRLVRNCLCHLALPSYRRAFIRSPDNISIELLQKGERKAPAEPWKSMPNTGQW